MKKSSRAGQRVGLTAVVAAMVMLVAACGGSSDSTIPGASGPAKTGDTILGAGASFPAPLYSKWGSDYNGVSGVKLNYQSIGSGGGIWRSRPRPSTSAPQTRPSSRRTLRPAASPSSRWSSAASCWS